MKDLAEVCPLSRGMMLQFLFPPLQGDIRFLRIPLPALPLTHLAAVYRSSEENGLTVFCISNSCGLGPLCLPVALDVHEGGGIIPPTRHSAFWLKLFSIFSLLLVTTSKTSVRMC